MDALLLQAEKIGFQRSTNKGAMTETGELEKTLSTTRTSHNTWCKGACLADPLVARLQRRIGEVTQTPEDNAELLQVLKYGTGQFYQPHQDESGAKGQLAGPRIMTLFMYLNNVTEGGHTEFPNVQSGLAVKPKRGSAVLWFNTLDQDVQAPDNRTLHAARPVITGQKLAANAWIHNDNYRMPNKWGCTGTFS
eukprot:TRINITY_DN26110_c0_g1_i1.p1 TRINITY_DN26110_c0_g1~~TRINITY_DN26110_c0_g1_i1.p1  ORF type:complete len:193 (-),score=45.18 TRINITY_DN26110_c0_g1_i1:99-677(-)